MIKSSPLSWATSPGPASNGSFVLFSQSDKNVLYNAQTAK
jgi:hypothetical protein